MGPVTVAVFGGVVLLVIVLTALWGLKILLGVAGLVLGLYLLATWLYTDHRHPDEVHYVSTKDGWDLAIWRVRPKTPVANPIPVLLQHGLGANQRNFDLDDRCSLAHYLARQGYDCYLPALRGNGPSIYRGGSRSDRWKITFEHFIDVDVPAAVEKIRELTGTAKIHFVGQSMGAMIGYALAEGEGDKWMQSFTAVCGPCFFKEMSGFKSILPFRFLLRKLTVLHVNFFMAAQAPLIRFFPRLAGREEVNWENMDGQSLARAAVNVVERQPATLLLQFAKWVEDGEFGSHRGADSWEKNLHKIKVPIYCLGGSADRFCPPAANNRVVDQVGSVQKQYRFFSKADGGLADYGHGDLIVGRTAPDEVFPTILDWIKATG